MFKLASEQELLDCFRPIERDQVLLNDELQFPLNAKDYLAWLEPSGARVYLVFKAEDFKAPLGVVFHRDQTAGPSVAAMCEWCHAVRSGNEIGMLTVFTHEKKRLGISLCRDLSCAQKIKADPSANDFNSNLPAHQRMSKLIQKMAHFARRELI